jgi:threonine dehydratase
MPDLKDIELAYDRIKNMVNHTPVMTSRTLNKMLGADVFFKCENLQRIGAFKFRGACNAISLLTPEQKRKGVITHSSGNHAQALALAASLAGVKVIIVMPETAPNVKKEATKGYGAKVVFCKPTLDARESTTNALIKEHGYTLIHPYDNDNVIAGAGTAAYELIKEVKSLDFMFCPVGGGGLLSGTSIATKCLLPKSKVIGVEPEKADDAFRSFRDNKLYTSTNPKTIADGLLTALSERTFTIIRKNVDEIITVTEKEIVDAMKFLWVRMKLVVEPSGAVSLAGLMKSEDKIKNRKVGVILSGGNIDLEEFFNNFYNKTQ